jgi:hypothetical protein
MYLNDTSMAQSTMDDHGMSIVLQHLMKFFAADVAYANPCSLDENTVVVASWPLTGYLCMISPRT